MLHFYVITYVWSYKMSIKRCGMATIVALVSVFIMGGTLMASEAFPAVTVSTLAQQLHLGDKPFLLDVREPEEHAMGHIEGAVLIPLGELQDHLSEIPKDKTVVVYCRSGNRSSRAIHYLMGQGYTNLINLSGGMLAWSKQCEGLGKSC